VLHPHNSAALEAPRGGFDLLLNPLVLLGVAPTATARDVNRAYEDAVEVGTAEIDLLHRAQQALLVPRLRIDAEVGGFLNVAPNEVTQLTEKLRTGAVRDDLNDLITNLAALPKSNVLAHLVARFPARASELIELIEAQAAITADAVYDAVTAARAQSRIGRVDSETVVHAISRLEERQIKAAIDKLLEESAFADSFTAFVRRALRTESEMIIGKLDVYVRAYSNAVSPEFSRRRERVTAACDALRANPKDLESTDRLLNALRHWNEIAEPLQMYEGHMLRDEPFTRGIYEQVRSLCIWLNDTQEEYKLPRANARAHRDLR
jgi:hypothetical protein